MGGHTRVAKVYPLVRKLVEDARRGFLFFLFLMKSCFVILLKGMLIELGTPESVFKLRW
jgi:hypothetical protein